MTVEYIKNLNRSYMILKDVAADPESFDMKMAVRGKIRAFLPMECILADGRVECWYDITGKQPLEVMLECQKADLYFLQQLISGIVGACQSAEAYLLDEKGIRFCPEYIFYDMEEKQYLFCYMPENETEYQEELEHLLELMLRRLDHGDERAVAAGYALYQKVAEGTYAISDLMQCFAEEENAAVDDWCEPEMDIPEEEVEESWNKVHSDTYGKEIWKKWKDIVKIKKQENTREKRRYSSKREKEKHFETEEKTRLHMGTLRGRADQKTVFLSAPTDQIQGQLLYQGANGQEHMLVDTGQDNFFIGSNIEAVDGYIKNDSVSRIHARIFRLKGDYFVEDLNSTNGTTLNGRPIVYRQKEKLNKNDRLVFATEEYLFC